jgi:hypothetical protein
LLAKFLWQQEHGLGFCTTRAKQQETLEVLLLRDEIVEEYSENEPNTPQFIPIWTEAFD